MSLLAAAPPLPAPSPRILDGEARAAHLAEVLKAVAHPLRLRIVALLAERDENVTRLCARLGAGQAIVSQQLRILRMHGLVEAEREGGFTNYRLAEPSLRDLVRCMEGCAVR